MVSVQPGCDTLPNARVVVACAQLHAIHNCKSNWAEPEKFLPERWLEPGAEYAQPKAGAEGAAPHEPCAWRPLVNSNNYFNAIFFFH